MNLLDGSSANSVVNSKAVIYGSSGEVAGTLSTAAQGNVTSLGTLTALTVDDVVINGATIGHGNDTDLITVADGVLTVAGELDAATLDISGNADIDGTLEADAYTVDGTALNEYIADTVGAMVSSNTETNITVTYQDGDNTLDFVIGTLNQDTTGTAATVTTAAQPNITSTGTLLNFASTGIDDNADALAVTITSAEAVGVGETVPLGKLHVKSADAGSITPSGNADELILEGSAHAGMTIYSGTTSTGLVNFGDSGHDSPGQIIYDHDDNSMDFVTNTGVNRIHITSAGAVGIGQGTPAATLHLKHPSGGTYMRWQDGSSNYAYEWGVENGEGNAFLLKNITGCLLYTSPSPRD